MKRVRELSGTGALVIAGDFNLSADTAEDRALLQRFQQALQLVDSGARSDPAGPFARKRIDYILYRDGPGVWLQPLEVGEAREFADGDAPLSDHPALFVRFEVRPVEASRPVGASRTSVP